MNLDRSFGSAQSTFSKWATDWTIGENVENFQNRSPDLLDLITIFQILGFSVSHIKAFEPEEISKLEINISCTHSGLKFALESNHNCSCWDKKSDSTVCHNLLNREKETNEGLSIIPPINVPEGEKLVIQTVLSHLFYMMHEATKTSDQNQNMAKAFTGDEEENQNIGDNEKNSQKEAPSTNTLLTETKTPLKIVIPSDDYFTARMIKTEILEKSPEVVMSPSRYRSLDTLTAKKILLDEIPEPGQLKKKEDATEKKSVLHVAYSSPNLSIPSKPSNTSSPVANITILKTGYSKLLCVQELVKDVIDILEKAQEIPKVSFDVSNIKASTESLCAKKTTVSTSSSDPNLIVKRNIKPLCRPPIRPTTSNKSIVATTSKNILLKPNTRRKSSENVSPNLKMNIKPATVSSSSKSQKFAHVKSTIPKTNVCKKL